MLINTNQERVYLTNFWIIRFRDVAYRFLLLSSGCKVVATNSRHIISLEQFIHRSRVKICLPSVATEVTLVAHIDPSGGYRRKDGHQESHSRNLLHPFFLLTCCRLAGGLICRTWLHLGHGCCREAEGDPYQHVRDELRRQFNWLWMSSITRSWESTVLISNNATVQAYLKKQGGTVSPVMCTLTQEILDWTEQFSVFLKVRYILGKKYIMAGQ